MKVDRTTLEAEIRRRVAQGESDATIGRALGLAASTVWNWRQRFGIPPADTFPRNFETTYGPGALEAFAQLYRQGWTYQELGAHFGFTRQNAQLIARKVALPPRRRARRRDQETTHA